MKSLKTLIRLHRRTLDEFRRKQVELERQKEILQQVSRKLREELEFELQLAAESPQMGHFFGNFADRIKSRRKEIDEEVYKVNQNILQVNKQIAIAFSEVKKFEVALENLQKREREARERKEQIMMDDIAIDQFIRKEESFP